MPAGMVRPRASQAPTLTDHALAVYRAAGWTISGRRIGAGHVVGPCAACHTPTVRYGPHGRPLCHTCRATPDTVAEVIDLAAERHRRRAA
ncbi:hypothetical protein O7632_31105 [Solwaraspora sp. WMMD406]|uniref:hypothetical protein n=1 Tax=Solwaraspora sp. WMMD406 TaxID=3016095 RepID=UPI00241758A3|nr:hypothetical protein [Solwaraspora sp. WMMD406]MDG4768509.1 hypothetical protein [Solwaraspora sp. WMMD406]